MYGPLWKVEWLDSAQITCSALYNREKMYVLVSCLPSIRDVEKNVAADGDLNGSPSSHFVGAYPVGYSLYLSWFCHCSAELVGDL